jgi:DNA-binding NarL/FixJ family response regulator
MKCQHCGSRDTIVLETREVMDGIALRRRRRCSECIATFNTYEIDGGIWGTVRRWALGSRKPALDKKHALRQRNLEITEMIRDGVPYIDIASNFNIAVTTVCYVAKKAGVSRRIRLNTIQPAASPWVGLMGK